MPCHKQTALDTICKEKVLCFFSNVTYDLKYLPILFSVVLKGSIYLTVLLRLIV
jgi:hypothetical protein